MSAAAARSLQRAIGNRALTGVLTTGSATIQRVDYSGPTIGIEQEIGSGQKVIIPNENDGGVSE